MKTIKTNERIEAIHALQYCNEIIERVEKEPYFWKWIIIVFHNCIQNAMVCALTGANGIFTLKQNLEEKCVNAILSKNNYPEEKLDYFEELYKKTKQDRYMQHYVFSQTFKASENIDESITRFNKYRNKFIHFTPQIFILNPSGLPQLFIELIKYLEFIGNESENILWYRNEGKVFAKGLQTLKQKCKYLEEKYNRKTK